MRVAISDIDSEITVGGKSLISVKGVDNNSSQ